MGIQNNIKKFLGVVTKKEYEYLSKDIEELKEELAVQKLLQESTQLVNPKTFTSSIAREQNEKIDQLNTVRKRVPVKQLQTLYLNNQFIFRGVNVRADELVTRGYRIEDGDEEGRKLCQELIDISGGHNLFWQCSINTDNCGDGYLELVPNEAKTKIGLLKHLNPVNFGFETDEKNRTKIKVDNNGNPKGYMQIIYDEEGNEKYIPIPKERIAHLKFNTFGDEFNGISSLQPVYNTAIRLMNMEHAAAEAAVKTANPTWIVTTETKSPQELAKWVSILGRISSQEVVFLPSGLEVQLKSPGNQNFNDYSDYFLNAVVSCLGVPKSILTGSSDSGGGNRSTVLALSKHFYSVIRSNQRYMEALFNEIFRKYAKMAGFKAPKLKFNDIAEDLDRNTQHAIELYSSGLFTLEESRKLLSKETPAHIKEELLANKKENTKSNISPDKEEKESDMEAWHPENVNSVSGSQKNEKKNKKYDPDIKSVR